MLPWSPWLLLLRGLALSALASDELDTSESCTSDSCAERDLDIRQSEVSCAQFYKSLPDRTSFFARVKKPPHLSADQFGMMLAKGGIHPRGVVMDTEFYELPLLLNHSLLEQEMEALLHGIEWEQASKGNVKQGVVSRHLRLTRSLGEDLEGPFEDAQGRLARSPYIRTVLAHLGGVVGNVALMSLEPGSVVDTHFDLNKYWDARVRVHIPIRTNKKVRFFCGQRDEMQRLNMKRGKAYIFDNHLGHRVENKGKSSRIHLAVDLVGSRKFWALASRSRALGSGARPAPDPPPTMLEVVADSKVVVEAWRDADLEGGCKSLHGALVETAAQIGLKAEAQDLSAAWCASIEGRKMTRMEELRELRRLAAQAACAAGPEVVKRGTVGLAEVADAAAELHRLDEAIEDLRWVGGQAVP